MLCILIILFSFQLFYFQDGKNDVFFSFTYDILFSFAVEMPDNGRNSLLLSEEFLRNCMEMFSVPSRTTHESNKRVFQQKHLNIIDPLKENNNLGRSVHRGIVSFNLYFLDKIFLLV